MFDGERQLLNHVLGAGSRCEAQEVEAPFRSRDGASVMSDMRLPVRQILGTRRVVDQLGNPKKTDSEVESATGKLSPVDNG